MKVPVQNTKFVNLIISIVVTNTVNDKRPLLADSEIYRV